MVKLEVVEEFILTRIHVIWNMPMKKVNKNCLGFSNKYEKKENKTIITGISLGNLEALTWLVLWKSTAGYDHTGAY